MKKTASTFCTSSVTCIPAIARDRSSRVRVARRASASDAARGGV
jgi:hypothetical protein